MTLRDTLSLAFRTVRSNRLRTGITVAIIALGITALIGINTAIAAIKQKFVESFSSMGASGFTIRYQEPRNFFRNDEVKKEKKGAKKEKKSNQGKPVTVQQAEAFKQSYQFPSLVSINLQGVNNAIVAYENKKTNPNVRVVGGDENYTALNGFS